MGGATKMGPKCKQTYPRGQRVSRVRCLSQPKQFDAHKTSHRALRDAGAPARYRTFVEPLVCGKRDTQNGVCRFLRVSRRVRGCCWFFLHGSFGAACGKCYRVHTPTTFFSFALEVQGSNRVRKKQLSLTLVVYHTRSHVDHSTTCTCSGCMTRGCAWNFQPRARR